MKKLRTKFIVWMYHQTQQVYRQFFKKHKREWQFSEEQLLAFEKDSLGRRLGEFYQHYGFRMIPKMENHDVYHLLTGYGTQVKDEIAMQYLLFGNGKRSAYLLGVLALGTLVFPEHILDFRKAYFKGKKMRKFHNLDFESLLWQNFTHLQNFIKTKQILTHF